MVVEVVLTGLIIICYIINSMTDVHNKSYRPGAAVNPHIRTKRLKGGGCGSVCPRVSVLNKNTDSNGML